MPDVIVVDVSIVCVHRQETDLLHSIGGDVGAKTLVVELLRSVVQVDILFLEESDPGVERLIFFLTRAVDRSHNSVDPVRSQPLFAHARHEVSEGQELENRSASEPPVHDAGFLKATRHEGHLIDQRDLLVLEVLATASQLNKAARVMRPAVSTGTTLRLVCITVASPFAGGKTAAMGRELAMEMRRVDSEEDEEFALGGVRSELNGDRGDGVRESGGGTGGTAAARRVRERVGSAGVDATYLRCTHFPDIPVGIRILNEEHIVGESVLVHEVHDEQRREAEVFGLVAVHFSGSSTSTGSNNTVDTERDEESSNGKRGKEWGGGGGIGR